MSDGDCDLGLTALLTRGGQRLPTVQITAFKIGEDLLDLHFEGDKLLLLSSNVQLLPLALRQVEWLWDRLIEASLLSRALLHLSRCFNGDLFFAKHVLEVLLSSLIFATELERRGLRHLLLEHAGFGDGHCAVDLGEVASGLILHLLLFFPLLLDSVELEFLTALSLLVFLLFLSLGVPLTHSEAIVQTSFRRK